MKFWACGGEMGIKGLSEFACIKFHEAWLEVCKKEAIYT